MLTDNPRLARQLEFIERLDKLKGVRRQSLLTDSSRRENSAEHSWHIALMALVLAEYAPDGTDLSRVIRMLLVHDVIEIECGDTFAYDAAGNETKQERELAAADRIFGLLPDDLRDELRALWDEFEAGESPEARFANALDRTQPLLQNYRTDYHTWRIHPVTPAQVEDRMAPVREGAPDLWSIVEEMYRVGRAKGYLQED